MRTLVEVGVPITAQVGPNQPPTRLLVRKNVEALDAAELAAFRAAVTAVLALTDTRGYEYFAGWHGVPFGWCEHHDPLFLPWHRAYLYLFELALRDQSPGLTLPWWDWTASAQIPDAYTTGGTTNVLTSVPITVFGGTTNPDWPTQTSREPGAFPHLPGPPYKTEWDHAMAAPNFTEFSRRLWGIHDTVHAWVGGTMGQVDWSAYDPLFWAHHANVDRAWRIWQNATAGGDPPTGIIDQALRVSPALTVRQVLSVNQLGYEYAGAEATVPGTQ